MKLSHTENQLGLMEMIEEAPEHDRTNYPEIADSTHMAQQVKDVFFLSEEMGQAENLIVIDEDEVFSEQCLGTLHHSHHTNISSILRGERMWRLVKTSMYEHRL